MEWIGFLITQIIFWPTKFFWQVVLLFIPSDDWVDRRVRAIEWETTAEKTIKAIYALLSILDSKASALMRFNGIILAVIALMLRDLKEMPPIGYWIVYMTLASIVACLVVVGIFWRFYEFVEPAPVALPADNDGQTRNALLAEELKMLRRVLRLREAAYQLAWWLAGGVSILLMLHFADFVKHATAT